MSVIINSMDKPVSCARCRFCNFLGQCCVNGEYVGHVNYISENCELKEKEDDKK